MEEEEKFKEVKNPQEFIDMYFPESESATSCIDCDKLAYDNKAGFLELFSLNDLRAIKQSYLNSQTRKLFYTMVLITRGEATEVIGHHRYTFSANQMYFIAENQLHAIESWSDDLKGIMCLFDADYFLLCLKHQIKLNNFPFFQIGQLPFINLSQRESTMMEHLFWKLQSEVALKATFNDDLLVRMFLNIILLESERIYNFRTPERIYVLSRKEQLAAKFQLLVNQKAIQLRKVSDYASLLNIHPHYLNDTVKEIVGASASAYIYKVIAEEAKSRLIQTSDTISMIAEELNFTDESYFSRFFKKQTGITPLQYRKKHKQH
ncbi:helix-turn-helix domain-containing protein [Myroides pelagicus]|uniref:Helix-turn-helix domain-containing protein n=1 Tax=Myroides pelagicus TaxID=270914 RepID=A0A7K1GH16_9FLAO|nr:helix-turn-helix domain-containing protein [Myroides pelagicus]MEC4113505.1 helix-turn-helix transcriptional regulator [Myroides pelagicus]MTH28342.1 helix-turn-helix domain-containing protein [Myroides pelagicus]